jgi:hypothetical protein
VQGFSNANCFPLEDLEISIKTEKDDSENGTFVIDSLDEMIHNDCNSVETSTVIQVIENNQCSIYEMIHSDCNSLKTPTVIHENSSDEMFNNDCYSVNTSIDIQAKENSHCSTGEMIYNDCYSVKTPTIIQVKENNQCGTCENFCNRDLEVDCTSQTISFNLQEIPNIQCEMDVNSVTQSTSRNKETNSSNDITSQASGSNENQISSEEIVKTTKIETENDDLKKRQLTAAKRSLYTNLFLIFTFTFVYAIIVLLPRREIFCLFVLSVMKGSMPIFTTIANFGTIHSVVSQYWDFLKGELSQLVSGFS